MTAKYRISLIGIHSNLRKNEKQNNNIHNAADGGSYAELLLR